MNALVFLAVVFTLAALFGWEHVYSARAAACWGFCILAAATFWALVIA